MKSKWKELQDALIDEKMDELMIYKQKVVDLKIAIVNMKEQVSQNAGIRNEYQDFDEFFDIADRALNEV